jgi:hypothetical protein
MAAKRTESCVKSTSPPVKTAKSPAMNRKNAV